MPIFMLRNMCTAPEWGERGESGGWVKWGEKCASLDITPETRSRVVTNVSSMSR